MFERIQGNDVYNAGNHVPFSEHVQFNNVSLSNPTSACCTGATQVAPITVAGINRPFPNRLQSADQLSVQLRRPATRFRGTPCWPVSYVGNMNRHQNDYRDINNPAPSQLAG